MRSSRSLAVPDAPERGASAVCGSCGSHRPASLRRGRGLTSLLPALAIAALPKCPMCLMAYATIFSSLGLGSAAGASLYTVWLLPVSALFLALAVAALGFRARQRHGYGPAILAVLAASALLFGKFRLDWLPMVYTGICLMLAACVWNTWPRKTERLWNPQKAPSGCR